MSHTKLKVSWTDSLFQPSSLRLVSRIRIKLVRTTFSDFGRHGVPFQETRFSLSVMSSGNASESYSCLRVCTKPKIARVRETRNATFCLHFQPRRCLLVRTYLCKWKKVLIVRGRHRLAHWRHGLRVPIEEMPSRINVTY